MSSGMTCNGSVANYLLNIDELAKIIGDSVTSEESNAEYIQRSKGFYIKSEIMGVVIEEWEVPYDIELVGVSFSQEDVRNMGYDDYINIYINGEIFVETVFLKEMAETKWFHSLIQLKEGDVIRVEYINDTGIEKEFKLDLDYINKETKVAPPPLPEIIKPIEPEPEPDQVPIYRVYMRYESKTTTDLDLYAHLYDKKNGSDITPQKTIGFSRRIWRKDEDNFAIVTQVSNGHTGKYARENDPEIIEIYGRPSRYMQFYVVNYKGGNKLTEDVTLEIFKVGEDGKDIYPALSVSHKPFELFVKDNVRVYFASMLLSSGKVTVM